jgi:hypothetical protein
MIRARDRGSHAIGGMLDHIIKWSLTLPYHLSFIVDWTGRGESFNTVSESVGFEFKTRLRIFCCA